MASTLLRAAGRGALAGTISGIASGAVAVLVGRPSVDRAIALEEPGAESVEVFSRSVQGIGLLVASILAGAALGVLFGVVYAVRYRQDLQADAWMRALCLAAAAFVGVGLIPFLRFPANPPGVGDPATVGTRTSGYLLAVLIGVASVVAAAQLYSALARRGFPLPIRHIAAAVLVIVGAALTWLLPDGSEATEVPPELLWEFRLGALATLATLWFVLGALFGLLGARAGGRFGSARGHQRDASLA